ncbi:hypothetical protein P691DRAFT_214288 [Macrolepiota fuliginosa MF-IS2]|uniref:Uncharacterized protein n=1 Tax=Macrolepiota fuliginosa MF-IS2 TaxID=1400762 RepID=A0A9P6BZH7_9AGAR|nr:hypothetical protein P691DRAFT_214288 [Macrolepiota fuliginosa MF-IS2]
MGPAAVVTPWTGPLARASEGSKHIRPGPLARESEDAQHLRPGGYSYDFDESDESDDWVEVKGMPPKPDPLLPPWPNRYYDSASDSDSDPFSPPSPAPFGMKKLYGSLNPAPPVIPPGVPHYNSSAGADTYPTSPPVIPSSSFTTSASAYGSPRRPVIPYGHGPSHTYSNHPGSTYGLSSPVPSGAFSPGYIPPPPLTSPAASHHSLPPNNTYAPGFIPPPPSLMTPAGPTASLPGMHIVSDAASAAAHAAAVAHGNASPYLYSTPRPLASPYVPAWISPQPSMNSSLPMTGSMTPGSTRGMPPYGSAYGPSSSGTPPY